MATVMTLLRSCIERFKGIITTKDFGAEYEILCAELSIQWLRILQWGDSVGLNSQGSQQLQDLLSTRKDLESTITQATDIISYLLQEIEVLRRQYEAKPGLLPLPQQTHAPLDSKSLDTFANPPNSTILRQRMQGNQEQKSCFTLAKWTLRDGKKFDEKIKQLKRIIEGLEQISQGSGIAQSPQPYPQTSTQEESPPPYSPGLIPSSLQSPQRTPHIPPPPLYPPEPTTASEWTLPRVLSFLSSNHFSSDWQNTFRDLNICGSLFLELGTSHSTRGNFSFMHLLYPRLAQECTTRGTDLDPNREILEGQRLRRLIREIIKTGLPSITQAITPPPPTSPYRVTTYLYPRHPDADPALNLHFTALKSYLGSSLTDPASKTRLAGEKLTKLPTTAMRELREDVYDEIIRRNANPRLDLVLREDLHKNRNIARLKIMTLTDERFKDLVTDIVGELGRRGAGVVEGCVGSWGFFERVVGEGNERFRRCGFIEPRLDGSKSTPPPFPAESSSSSPSSPLKSPQNQEVEIFKSIHIRMEDSTSNVILAALNKYNIQQPWEEYSLWLCWCGCMVSGGGGKGERMIGLDEKPLVVFKRLEREGKKPVFGLRGKDGNVGQAKWTRKMEGVEEGMI